MNARVAVRPKPAGGARRPSRPMLRRPGPRPTVEADAQRPLVGGAGLPELAQAGPIAETAAPELAAAPYMFGAIPLFPPSEVDQAESAAGNLTRETGEAALELETTSLEADEASPEIAQESAIEAAAELVEALAPESTAEPVEAPAIEGVAEPLETAEAVPASEEQAAPTDTTLAEEPTADQQAELVEAVPSEGPGADEEVTEPLAALGGVAAEPGESLPHRTALEAKLGRPLGDVQVHSGVASSEALDGLGAEAATLGQHVFLAEPSPALDVVAHEVVHALQAESGGGTPRATGAVVVESDPAEREAEQLSQQALTKGATLGKREPTEQVPAGSVALLRTGSAPAAVPPGSAATPSAAFAAATGPAGPKPPSSRPPSTAPGGATPPSRQPSTAPAGAGPSGGDVAPTLELPPPPTPGLTAEDVAAQQQKAAEAEAALAGAENVTGLMGAFAGAPPTVMAQNAGSLGSDTDRLAKSEEEGFQGSLPELHAELSGEVPAADTVEIPAPAARDVTLEATTPPPAPLPELPPTVDPGAYTANDGLARELLRHFTGEPGERAGEVGKAIEDVQTTDP
ncbi:MAG TPA: DUF4157 domain-containing protein, partial [Chloroflexota bacterium]|nr:DUF4157 domain-containing protein [Chloroflexota bacterium]